MRKIEVYENFNNHLGTLMYKDLLVNALTWSAEEALRQFDVPIIRTIAQNTELEWVYETVKKEKEGKKAVPKYVWDGASRYLQKMAELFQNEETKRQRNEPYTEEDLMFQKEIFEIDKKRYNPMTNTADWIILSHERRKIENKWSEVRTKYANEIFFNWDYGIDMYAFESVYHVKSLMCFPAYRDLASKLISYAQQLREADL